MDPKSEKFEEKFPEFWKKLVQKLKKKIVFYFLDFWSRKNQSNYKVTPSNRNPLSNATTAKKSNRNLKTQGLYQRFYGNWIKINRKWLPKCCYVDSNETATPSPPKWKRSLLFCRLSVPGWANIIKTGQSPLLDRIRRGNTSILLCPVCFKWANVSQFLKNRAGQGDWDQKRWRSGHVGDLRQLMGEYIDGFGRKRGNWHNWQGETFYLGEGKWGEKRYERVDKIEWKISCNWIQIGAGFPQRGGSQEEKRSRSRLETKWLLRFIKSLTKTYNKLIFIAFYIKNTINYQISVRNKPKLEFELFLVNFSRFEHFSS